MLMTLLYFLNAFGSMHYSNTIINDKRGKKGSLLFFSSLFSFVVSYNFQNVILKDNKEK